VGRFLLSVWLVWALSAIAIMLYWGAAWWGDFSGWRSGLMIVLWIVFSYFSLRNLKSGQARCWLSWDGSSWYMLPLFPNPTPTIALQSGSALSVHLDLQHLLFVSLLNAQGKRHWFWLSKESFPDRWHGFRCAVYSRSEEFSS
jgi:hypothetical protein